MGSFESHLERALPIVAAAYGEQFGVDVVLSGKDAYTNGQTIVLPMLDNISELKNVLFGYLAHEAAHVRDSDFDVVGQCQNPFEKSVLNIIEDIRIEKVIQECFPGTQFTLDAMWSHIVESDMSPPAKPDDNEATQLHQYLLHRLRSEYLGRSASDPLAQTSLAVVEESYPVGFFVRLDGILAKYMPTLSNTADCLMVTRAILKAVSDAEEEEKNDNQDGENQSGDSGSSSNQDQSSGGGDDSSGQTDGSDPSDGSDDQGNSQSNADSGNSEPTGQDESTESNPSGDTGSLHEKLISESDLPEDVVEQLRGSLENQAADDNANANFSIDVDSVGADCFNSGDTGSLQSGILASSAIRSRLTGLLAAQNREHSRLHTRGSRVDGKRLARIATGDSRVFIQRDDVQRTNTSVHLLLDSSGSMVDIQDIANQATVSLSLAVSAIPNCDIASSMFPGIGGAVSPIIRRGQPVRPNLGKFAVKAGGGTPLAPAMLYAARELATSNKSRKVMIVITDGEPANGHAVKYMNSLVSRYVDVYAIGIGTNAVSQYFDKWSVINDVSELQQALFQVAGKFLDLH